MCVCVCGSYCKPKDGGRREKAAWEIPACRFSFSPLVFFHSFLPSFFFFSWIHFSLFFFCFLSPPKLVHTRHTRSQENPPSIYFSPCFFLFFFSFASHHFIPHGSSLAACTRAKKKKMNVAVSINIHHAWNICQFTRWADISPIKFKKKKESPLTLNF